MIRHAKDHPISELLADTDRVTDAIRQAGRDARLRHKQMGVPLVVWRDGKVVEIPPEEIVVDPPANTAQETDSRTLTPDP